MPNKYKVTMPDGTTGKRTSANRTYTHVVIAQLSEEYERRAADVIKWLESDYLWYAYQVRAGLGAPLFGHNVKEFRNQSSLITEKDLAHATKRLGGAKDFAEYAENIRLEKHKRIDERAAQGVFTKWLALTWIGRPDLVASRLATYSSEGAYKNIEAREVESV